MSFPSPFDGRIAFNALVHRAVEPFALSSEELEVAPLGASAKRQIEFALGRRAAGGALEALGHGSYSPLPRRGRLPLWPTGVKGSISHTRVAGTTHAVAAATTDPRIVAVGVDIEAVQAISEGVLRRISHPAELAWVGEREPMRRAVALFSAREALFKAISPLYCHRMRYRETTLTWDETVSGFHAVTELPLIRALPLETVVTVHSLDQIVLAGVTIDAPAGATWYRTSVET